MLLGCVACATPQTPQAGERVPGECEAPRPEWIWCDDFDVNRLGRYFEFVSAGGAFTREDGAGRDGSGAMVARWRDPGQVRAGDLHLAFGRTPDPYFRPVDEGTTLHRRIFWRMYVRLDDGWSGGSGHKLARATSFATAEWAQAMVAHVWGGSRPTLALDPASGTTSDGELATGSYNDLDRFRWLGAVESRSEVFGPERRGVWQCIEAEVELESPGARDGAFRLWVDGALEAERTGLDWVGGSAEYGVNALFVENYWDGGAPAPLERAFDNLVVSTERIGCLAPS